MSDTSKTCCHLKKGENIRKGPPDHGLINLLKLLKKNKQRDT